MVVGWLVAAAPRSDPSCSDFLMTVRDLSLSTVLRAPSCYYLSIVRGTLGTRYPKPALESLIRPRARSDGLQTSHQRHQRQRYWYGGAPSDTYGGRHTPAGEEEHNAWLGLSLVRRFVYLQSESQCWLPWYYTLILFIQCTVRVMYEYRRDYQPRQLENQPSCGPCTTLCMYIEHTAYSIHCARGVTRHAHTRFAMCSQLCTCGIKHLIAQ